MHTNGNVKLANVPKLHCRTPVGLTVLQQMCIASQLSSVYAKISLQAALSHDRMCVCYSVENPSVGTDAESKWCIERIGLQAVGVLAVIYS